MTDTLFSSVYLNANQTLAGVWTTILFNIIETDGQSVDQYNATTGRFTAARSGWYDVEVSLQTSAPLTGLRLIKNGDGNTAPMSRVDASTATTMKCRLFLAQREYVEIQGIGAVDVLATSGTVPDARSSNCIFTLVKSV